MSLLSRPLHLWGTLPWGWPRWRDGLLAHLWRWKSQQDDQWGCVPPPAEVSLPAILPETGVEESDLWLRDLAQKTQKWRQMLMFSLKKKMVTILAPSTVKEMDASWSLYQPDSLWWPSSLRPFQRKWQEVAKCNEWRPAGTGAASAAPYWSHRDGADVGERPLDVRPIFSQLVSNGNMVVSYK